MKYFLYLRKSTEEKSRQILSIESQKEEMIKRFPDIEIIEILEEHKSAFKPYNRPIFNRMLERIQNGEAQGIVAWDPSRLSRNPISASMIIHFLDTGVLKDLKFGSFHFDNSPEGKMMLSFAMSQSKYSSDKLSKDVKRGMLKKCDNGHRPGMATVGYMNEPTALKGEKRILSDPERFELVRKMWDMLLSGTHSVSQIHKIICDEWRFTTRKYKKIGGRPLALSTLYEIFTNPFYYGEFEWDGEWYKGAHEQMITKEEFDRAQVILGRKGRPRPQKHRFPFTGVIKCATCGCAVTAEHKLKKLKKAKKTRIYTYYHCTRKGKARCSEKSIPAHELELQIQKILGTITIPENLLKCTLKHLEKMNKEEVNDRGNIQKSVQKAYNDCTKRIDNLLKLFIDPANSDKEILSDEEFKSQKISLLREKEELSTRLNDCDRRQNDWVELTEKTFKFVTYAQYHFEHGTLDEKKAIFQALGQNFLLKDKKLLVELHQPFELIKKGMEKTHKEKGWIPLILEPDFSFSKPKYAKIANFWSSTSDDVRTVFDGLSSSFSIFDVGLECVSNRS